jgi:methylase of polypeptide subunit release factors
MSGLTKESEDFYNQTDIKERKKKGQYFTNDKIKKECLKHVDLFDGMKILENSCGTGEFINSILMLNPNVSIDAYDIDQDLVDIVRKAYPLVNSYCEDWLLNKSNKKYDLIIGNPPYFELNKKQCKERGYEEFLKYSKSKANIYSFFIQKSITKLNPGGKLIYVVPTSMNNGYSFSPLREFIVETCNVQSIELFSDNEFDSAQQNVMILVLERLNNDVNDSVNIFTREEILLFFQTNIKK